MFEMAKQMGVYVILCGRLVVVGCVGMGGRHTGLVKDSLGYESSNGLQQLAHSVPIFGQTTKMGKSPGPRLIES
jgi:hypothetical protein